MAKYKCSATMQDFLRELPKCEHHLHLEGTLEPDLLFPLAKRNNISLPQEFPQTVEELNVRYTQFKDLQDFLNFYYIGTNVLLTEQDFFDLAWAYFTKVSKQGLKHAEVFYDPQSHTSRGISLATVTAGFERACRQAQEELGITTKLIMCLLRHCTPEDCMSLIDEAESLIRDGSIHGLGLDSAEKPFPPELFTECYAAAKKINGNLQLTAHAGEEGGPEYISNSLDLLNVTRIDHGVNSIKDAELMQRLAREQIMLTVCPLSNVRLQVVKDVSELPLQKFLDNNVPFSLNSDDPAYFGGYVLDNYIAVHTRFGWDLETWCRVAKNGIKGSWCDGKRKDELLAEVDSVYKKYKALV